MAGRINRSSALITMAVLLFALAGTSNLLSGAAAAATSDDFVFDDDEDGLAGMLNDQSSGDGEIPPPDEPVVKPIEPPAIVPPPHPPRSSSTAKPPATNPLWPSLPSVPDGYSPFQVCGKRIYCRKGYRGPCHRNEVVALSTSSSSSQLTCPAGRFSSSSSNWMHSYGCLSRAFHSSSSGASGSCQLRDPHKPCFGYPKYYRYCKETKRCYPCRSRTTSLWSTGRRSTHHCGKDQIFVAVDRTYGHCRCQRANHVQFKQDRHCYPAYSKGPCPSGQWLVPYGGGKSTCRPSPCPSLADGHHIYWFGGKHYRAGCYRPFTRGPCRPGMYFKVDNYMTGAARCVYSQANRQSHHRTNLYSSLMDWPSYAAQSSSGYFHRGPPLTNSHDNFGFRGMSDQELFYGG